MYVFLKPAIEAGIDMGVEMEAAKDLSIEEANDMVDLSWTLEMVIEDPAGARGKWVVLDGLAHPADTNEPSPYPQEGGEVFYLGDLQNRNPKAIMVLTESGAPSSAAKVRVLGYIPSADPMGAITEKLGADTGPMVLFMLAREIEVL